MSETIMALAATALARAKYPPTADHIEGPFYRQGAPFSEDIYPQDSKGPILHFGGKVVDTDLNLLADIPVEFWHANDEGRYDNDDPDHHPAPNFFFCRGRSTTAKDGTFKFRTVLPGNYPIGPEVFRVKHIHFKFYPLGYEPLTTEVVLLPDKYAEADKFFKIPLGTQLEPLPKENNRDAYRAYFNFVMMRLPPRPTPYTGYALKAAFLSLSERH
jgi:protocatechuate 3,4-dioxygenase beta subunit